MSPPSNENKPTDRLLAEVGTRVQRLREARDVKPADFARAAGMTQQYLWRLEDGQYNLSLRTISRLALALDVPMTALIEGIEADPETLKKGKYVRKAGKAD